MIIIELIYKFVLWFWQYILKPIIRFFYWLITARDCKHCKYYNRQIMAHRDHCSKMEKDCSCTECYHAITRKDFERKK